MALSKDQLASCDKLKQDEEAANGNIMVNATPAVDGVAAHPESSTAVPVFEIVAPAMLMEGYELDAQVGDRVMKLTIPPGGVEKGQKFKVSMNQETATDKSKVPVGHWKDALCDCCRYGLLHATCFISCCFPALAAAQVINRMGLNWLGYPARNEAEKTSAFRTVFIITVVQLGLRPLGYTIFQITYFLFSFFIVMNVRSYVRAKYAIPETSCCLNGTEDCCVSYWCLWCTASQMLRHTGNYEMYAASDCSENGFSPHVKAVTV